MTYPASRTTDDVDELAGVVRADPFRWLEDGAGEEVRQWQKAQNELASSYARRLPGYEQLSRLVARCSVDRFGAPPVCVAGGWFRHAGGVVVMSDEPYGEGRAVFDPLQVLDGHPVVSWFVPSPDGALLAVGVCGDGSEQNTPYVVDLESGEVTAVPGRLMDAWSGGVAWLPDSSGFLVTLVDGAAIDLVQRVWHVDLRSGTRHELDVPWLSASDYRMVQPSADGTRLVAYESVTHPRPVAIAPLGPNPVFRPFVDLPDNVVAGHFFGDTYLAVTDLDAPRGRVVAISAARAEPEHWVTVVPESEAVLRTLTRVGDVAYLHSFVDTYSRLEVIRPDGTRLGEVSLPGRGAVAEHHFPYLNLARRTDPDHHVFAFSTLTSSWSVHLHDPVTGELVELLGPEVHLEADVEDCWATSADGFRVPYHVVRGAAAVGGALISAYGGFNAPWVPQYPGALAAFVAAGGTLVHAHLRGGGEFGRDGWEAGRRARKQSTFDDLYAVAEDLLATGRATSLAVTGASNGGLLAAVAVTQRPELWQAVVPRVPITDLLGGCREAYARHAIGLDYADLDDPADVERLLTFSPYHLVTERAYPAVFLDAGDTDPRCSPWHARKLAAALQGEQQGPAPVLLHVWEDVGHGWATDATLAVQQSTEWLAFVCQQLDVSPG